MYISQTRVPPVALTVSWMVDMFVRETDAYGDTEHRPNLPLSHYGPAVVARVLSTSSPAIGLDFILFYINIYIAWG